MRLRCLLLVVLLTSACSPDTVGGPPAVGDLPAFEDAAPSGGPIDAAADEASEPPRDDAAPQAAPLAADGSSPAPAEAGEESDADAADASVAAAPDAAQVMQPEPVLSAVRVNVQGLVGTPGSGLELSLNGTSTLTVDSNGSFAFPGALPEGGTYSVTLRRQPSELAHVCALGAHTGTVHGSAGATVEVTCSQLSGLRISEVGSCYYVDSSCWLEIYNAGPNKEQLALHQLRAPAAVREFPYGREPDHLFALPSLWLQPGQYALVAAASSGALPDGQGVVHVRDGTRLPWWSGDGFLELLLDGRTVDFVRFGDDTSEPRTLGNYGGDALASLRVGSNEYGRALARDLSLTDHNSASDWHQRAFATPMGPNDVSSDADDDNDGIPDEAEQPGGRLSGIDLYAMGARRGVRDMFVEIDRMASSDPALSPRREALDKLVAVYAEHGIALHFDVGDLFAPSFDETHYNLGGGNVTPFSWAVGFQPEQSGIADLYAYKAAHMAPERRSIFYYMLFGYSQERDGSAGSSGIGELLGNDTIITLGGYGLNVLTQRSRNLLANYQASTMMHELGHNLSLGHGGDESLNYKPNYLSVMNYLYGSRGLPTIGEREGDRYDLTTSCTLRFMSQLTRSPYESPSGFLIDYSHGEAADLDERHVRESEGLGQLMSVAVDYDCSGDVEDDYAADLNFDGKLQTLRDHDDWQNLELVFRRLVSSNDSGPGLFRVRTRDVDLTVDDRQPLAPDPCPGAQLTL